jgi:hypothetical protein
MLTRCRLHIDGDSSLVIRGQWLPAIKRNPSLKCRTMWWSSIPPCWACHFPLSDDLAFGFYVCIYSCTHTGLYCRFAEVKHIKRFEKTSDSASPTVEITRDWSIQLTTVIQSVQLERGVFYFCWLRLQSVSDLFCWLVNPHYYFNKVCRRLSLPCLLSTRPHHRPTCAPSLIPAEYLYRTW